MTDLEHFQERFEPLYHGMPVLVRLVRGDDILCIIYRSLTSDDERMIMERPLLLTVDPLPPNLPETPQASYARVRTRFERWIPFSDANMFPIYGDHILSIAPLTEGFINTYMEWADQLYQLPLPTNQTASSPEDADKQIQDIRDSYFDFILANFHPKGRPN